MEVKFKVKTKRKKEIYKISQEVFIFISTFLILWYNILNPIIDYKQILTYVEKEQNLANIKYKFSSSIIIPIDIDLTQILSKNYFKGLYLKISYEKYIEIINEYQYIRNYILQIKRRKKLIDWKTNAVFEKFKRKLKGKINHQNFLLEAFEKVKKELKELYISQYYVVLNNIFQDEPKKIWKSLQENFSFDIFNNFVSTNSYIIYFKDSPFDYIKRINKLYEDYLIILKLNYTINEKGFETFSNDEDYFTILEILPKYFFDLTLLIEPQEEFFSEEELANRYNNNIAILNNVFNNTQIGDNRDDRVNNFYIYFMNNRVEILNTLNILLNRFSIIQSDNRINKDDLTFYNLLITDKSKIEINNPKPYLLYIYFTDLYFKSFMEKIFSSSPIKSFIPISNLHTYSNLNIQHQRSSFLTYNINGITDHVEFFQYILSNLKSFYNRAINDNYFSEKDLEDNNINLQFIIYKKDKISGKSYEYYISTPFDTIENMREDLINKFLQFLFELEIVISYYTTELESENAKWDIGLDTTKIDIGYQLEPKLSGFDYLIDKIFIKQVENNDADNPFKENGFIYNATNNGHDCFCYCMEYLGYQDVRKILSKLNINYNKNGISFIDIEKFALNQNIYIEIYDTKIKDFIYKGIEKKKIYKLISHNGHFMAFSKNQKGIKLKKIKLPIKLVFFDLETLTRIKDKVLCPLSNFYFHIDEKDFNEFNYQEKKKEYKKNCIFNSNPNFISTNKFNPLNPMVNDILRWSENYQVKLIGYNSSAFDMFFVMDSLKNQLQYNLDLRKNCSVFIAKNRIYQLKYKNLKSFDLYLHLRMSLYDACIAFNTNPIKLKETGENIIEKLQESYENNTLLNCYENEKLIYKEKEYLTKKLLYKYNKMDVMSLVSLFKNYQDLIKELDPFKNFKIWDSMTLPSMINKYFQNNIYNEFELPAPYTRRDYLTFKSWQTAGIVGIFGKNNYSKKINNIYLFDIVSQYPYVCMTFDFPKGEYSFKYYKDNEEPNLKTTLGNYKCLTNTSFLYLPIVGKKNPNKTNSWNTQKNEMYECSLTTPEILYIRNEYKKYYIEKNNIKAKLTNQQEIEIKNCVQILSGFTFIEKCNPFKGFMLPIAIKKIKLDILKNQLEKEGKKLTSAESTLRTLYKLILNATTGAVNQKLHETETLIKENGFLEVNNLKTLYDTKNENDNNFLNEKYENRKKLSRPYLGTFIYAYARLEICNIANEIEKYNDDKNNPCVIYGDTDSLVITEKGLKIWKNHPEEKIRNKLLDENNIETLGQFGYFKCEGFFSEGYLIDKKIYCLYNKNDCYPKCKCSLSIVKKGECNNKNKYRLKGIGNGKSIDKKNGYYVIPIKKDKKILNEDLKKIMDNQCKENTLKYIREDCGIDNFYNEENDEKIIILYEKNYYRIMRELEKEYFDNENKIENMRDIEIYELLYNGYQLKVIRENMLDRRISKGYCIKQITKEILMCPNTWEYDQLKLEKQIKKRINNCSKNLKKCVVF